MADNNLDKVIQFKLDGGAALERTLVARPVEDMASELNAQSPIGKVLLTASAGEVHQAETPGGVLAVEVLNVANGAAARDQIGELEPVAPESVEAVSL